MKFQFTSIKFFKNAVLFVSCSVFLSAPVFGITAKNETKKTVTCWQEKSKTGPFDKIETSKTWKKKCNVLKPPHHCIFYCTYENQPFELGTLITIDALSLENKYNIVEKQNKPTFEKIKK